MASRPIIRRRVLIGLVVFAAIYAYMHLHASHVLRSWKESPRTIQTDHYSITSSATEAQTMQIGQAVESLNQQYLAFFGLPAQNSPRKLRLTLYKDRDQFKQQNAGAQWAEAYYRTPDCHAYFAADEANPYHWMIHEATHQLNYEVARFSSSKWINEGLATYFGSSKIEQGTLVPGRIDINTYPIWAVARLTLTGDLESDVGDFKVIGLRALISGTGGPDINEKFNTYYIGYWSLTHFLFHFEQGKYAQPYRKLIASGGSIDDFEKLIGPIEQIQAEWYAYLMQQTSDIATMKRNNANS
jgi:hypothetical protein